MTSEGQIERSEREALELLPWYVNGTLAEQERELVRRELSANLTCRKEFERLRRLQALMRTDDAEAAADEQALERLIARIDGGGPFGRARWLPLAQAAALLLLVAGLGWWWSGGGLPGSASHTYETLTTPRPVQAGIVELRVVFTAGLSEAVLRELLVEHRLTIVDGPTPNGVYTLALDEAADPATVRAALEGDPRIAFVSRPATTEN